MNLNFENISKSFGEREILINVSGRISQNDKIGLIGANGIGKTTLAKILSRNDTPDSGRITCSPTNMKVFYIDQHPVFESGATAFKELSKILTESNKHMGAEYIINKALNASGIKEDLWGQDISELSGGEKTKVVLCKAMLADYDLLVLDEPTNYLDMEGLRWIEEMLNNIEKPMLIISHDRYFLDKAANKIWEMTSGGIKAYEGNYTSYKNQKDIELKNVEKEYEKQQVKMEHLRRAIGERRQWFERAHKAAGQSDFYRAKAKKHMNVLKAKEKELERVEQEKVEKPKKVATPAFDIINKNIVNKKLPPYLIQVRNLSKSFGDKNILDSASFNVTRMDKIALIGENGAGKTTLLKIINDDDHEYEGSVVVSPSTKIGYFAQELNGLDYDKTVLENIIMEGASEAEARLLLACLLFKGDEVFKKAGILSMGEKCRVAFAKLIISGASLLILDEPTNYMDIESREKIEEVLEDYCGSILLVSHDRYFISKISNKIIKIENRKLKIYEGDYEHYLEKSREEKAIDESPVNYAKIKETINLLECELAYMGGRLDGGLDEEEKNKLNNKYIETARQLNKYKDMIKLRN
ncbi:ribosomal protection-like ABC-F family protein [Lutispora saccharofermentans]|uniref:ABC-F type ribosomal protection protein n=1 Tax=Lutispora saccharofermentans TaxID=3024236 RepID=A0ABT1NHG6_9FIRM|nr:ABC-F type ribosomal protection protein [Lutispora saccharofermentans]MCQ1529593.1 ABC-F type ribosomal protection protein [Lutispora saccharofermentans]